MLDRRLLRLNYPKVNLSSCQRVLEPRVDRERLGCAYTQHSYDEEGGFTSERFDPHIDDANPWYLIEINGNAPTIEQLDSYKPTARERHPAILDFGLIDFESLKHAAREGQTSNYSFKINPDYSSVMNESLEGSLTVQLVPRGTLKHHDQVISTIHSE